MFVLIIIQWPLPNIWCQLISCDVRWSCCKANDLNISLPSFSQSWPGLFRKPEAKNADVVIQTPEAEVKKAICIPCDVSIAAIPIGPLVELLWHRGFQVLFIGADDHHTLIHHFVTGPFINVDPKDPKKPWRRRSTDCELRVTSMAQATTWWRLHGALFSGWDLDRMCVWYVQSYSILLGRKLIRFMIWYYMIWYYMGSSYLGWPSWQVWVANHAFWRSFLLGPGQQQKVFQRQRWDSTPRSFPKYRAEPSSHWIGLRETVKIQRTSYLVGGLEHEFYVSIYWE